MASSGWFGAATPRTSAAYGALLPIDLEGKEVAVVYGFESVGTSPGPTPDPARPTEILAAGGAVSRFGARLADSWGQVRW